MLSGIQPMICSLGQHDDRLHVDVSHENVVPSTDVAAPAVCNNSTAVQPLVAQLIMICEAQIRRLLTSTSPLPAPAWRPQHQHLLLGNNCGLTTTRTRTPAYDLRTTAAAGSAPDHCCSALASSASCPGTSVTLPAHPRQGAVCHHSPAIDVCDLRRWRSWSNLHGLGDADHDRGQRAQPASGQVGSHDGDRRRASRWRWPPWTAATRTE